MSVPDWRVSKAGTRTRVALWLHSEVGPGGTFTKAQLREAFPAAQQVDRRMRELREHGWVIEHYRGDRSLSSSEELRLVEEGAPVWERGYRSPGNAAVTNKERQAIFAADNYMCLYCGITSGEPYPDDPSRTAKLSLGRGRVHTQDALELRTACDRCLVAATEKTSAADMINEIEDLDGGQRQRLRGWVHRGQRTAAAEERVWARYRRLPRDVRREVEAHLGL